VEVIVAAEGLREACDAARSGGNTVGFVPTMGFFHEGHRSLMRRARADRDTVVVSIFLNPLQFGPSEDIAAYPQDLDRDLADAEREGVDVVFAPDAGEMYPGGPPDVTVHPGPIGERLEGASRPGHFRGVATAVAKLFNLIGPARAYFGEKDAQQLAVIRRMGADLGFPVEVVGCPTVREPDGLAMSSRNSYLSPEERQAATCLYRALSAAAEYARLGVREAPVLKAEMAKRIGAEPLARIDYVAVVDEESFEEVEQVVGPGRALVAARFGRARLIDNMALLSGG
jgi:pantoate--beta-alanine ligase